MPTRNQEVEVERLLRLVRADVQGQPLRRTDPRLHHEHALTGVLGQHPVPVAVDLVHTVLVEVGAGVHGLLGLALLIHISALDHVHLLVPVRQALRLDHAVGDIHAESVHSAVQPEPEHAAELRPHLRVLPVQIRLG